ncbi:MAG TPA: acyl-CoA synthetase [Acidimicrobiales bacterium]|nr:acyl-CoA synthetase [Acidimicrobiales bacterium]
MTQHSFADIWEAVADGLPDAQAQVHGDRRYTWSEMDRRADGIARTLLDAGVQQQDKVAQYLYNGPEYLESLFGIVKAGLAPVNTNYRYTDDELVYLWDNADAVAVVFHGTFTETIERIRSKVPRVQTWLWVDDGSNPCPEWAVPYETAAGAATERTVPPWGRSGDDLYMLYTGGTTGMPKGVMWRQGDLFSMLNAAATVKFPEDASPEEMRRIVAEAGPQQVHLPACPLMHGTGALTSFGAMDVGGSIVTLTNRHFEVVELLDTIEREGVNSMAIVGDAFAKPMLRALDDAPGKWDISSLKLIASSGVMWSQETKEGLLRHHPMMLLSDGFSSSEAIGMGQSVSGGGQGVAKTAKFALGPRARVVSEDRTRWVEPGSGEAGLVALKGPNPLGYYKDEAKTAATFVTIDGERYSIPGDWATVEADGSLTLLGRGSVCINTGGEKVFPEEVEEVLKQHPSVADAVVVGVPDEKFGEAITAMVEARPGATVDEADVIAHVRTKLAAYKSPKRVFEVATIGRAPNGKVDYKRLKAEAIARI